MAEEPVSGNSKDSIAEKIAIALKYERGKDPAPRMAAKGRGYMAEQIIAIAREHGIEVREDRDLAKVLSALEVDSLIPMEAYVAVADILSYVYRANQAAKGKS